MSRLLLLCIPLSVGFISCENYKEKVILENISGSLDRTKVSVVQSNEQVYGSLDDQLRDPMVKAKAEIWYAKAQKVKELSVKLGRYLDSLKTQIKSGSKNDQGVGGLINREGVRLYTDLWRYCEAFPIIMDPDEFVDNPTFQEFLKKEAQNMLKYNASLLGFWKDSIRTSPMEAKQWVNNQFGRCAPDQVLLMLNKLQTDVLMIEKSMIDYFHVQIPTPCGVMFDSYSFIALINSNYVKTGQKMEIVAGEGAYTLALKPRVSISDSSLTVSSDGTATYSFTAEGKPGTYSIPVKITYFQVDGQERTFVKDLEYIIAQ